MFSLGFIVVVLLLAVFAYPLSPDDSSNANTMILEIGTRKPGFSCTMIKRYVTKEETNKGWLSYLLHGRHYTFEQIPVRDVRITSDSLFATPLLDEEISEPISFSLVQLAGERPLQADAASQFTLHRTFWLGTDRYGRDVLSRLILGTRVSMAVGCIAVFISIFIGILLGSLSGYFGSWIDQIITWLINVVWAIPTLLLVFAITFALGKGFWQIFIAVGCTMWVGTARLIRGQVMSLKELEYVQAARTMGFSSARILFRHILPNVMGPTIVMASSNFATAILIEAGLSFLGIGIQPPVSSWGLMMKENYNFIITNHPMLAIIPGVAIMLMVLAFNLLGNGLRDALDVKGRSGV
jgi:peptide/nickel transport system permease protein